MILLRLNPKLKKYIHLGSDLEFSPLIVLEGVRNDNRRKIILQFVSLDPHTHLVVGVVVAFDQF